MLGHGQGFNTITLAWHPIAWAIDARGPRRHINLMTRRFTAHEARPLRDARPKAPAPPGVKPAKPAKAEKPSTVGKAAETGGPSGPEPTRYGDWERKGICVDF